MKYVLYPLSGVDDDIANAVEWYESRREGLGTEFLDDWENTIAYVVSNPLGFAKKRKSFRQAVLKKFPYLIIFEIVDNLVVVYAVIHGRKHPKERYKRKFVR